MASTPSPSLYPDEFEYSYDAVKKFMDDEIKKEKEELKRNRLINAGEEETERIEIGGGVNELDEENRDYGEIAAESNVLKADPEENGDVNDGRSKTLIQDIDVANPNAVEVEDEDMQISPTGIADNVNISQRVYVPQRRSRDPSSSAEWRGANKRRAITACKFYAKGWCMKGVSCRFSHVKDVVEATMMRSEDKSGIPCHREVSSSAHISSVNPNGMLNGWRSFDSSFSQPGQPLSSCFPSWNTDNYGTYDRYLNGRPSIYSSVQLGASSFPYREPGSYLQNHVPQDPNKCRVKMTLNDWEPSVPFQPSHQITRDLLSKLNLSVESLSNWNANVQSLTSEEESKVPTSANIAGSFTFHSGKQNDQAVIHGEQSAEVKVDVSRKGKETKAWNAKDEERALKQFQDTIIEHVKGLLKPAWDEGRLSRYAHKHIVRNSVNKVLISLENDLVPSTPQQIKSYLSRSQKKLEKLVKDHIETYKRL